MVPSRRKILEQLVARPHLQLDDVQEMVLEYVWFKARGAVCSPH